MAVEFRVQLKIQKPVAEVFEAVVDPDKLSGYFVGSASGPLETGKIVSWKFAEFPDLDIPVTVAEVRPNELIRFGWPTNSAEYNTTVTMTFESLGESETLISIHETGWRDDDKGREDSYCNCHGWMHMTCCMKAYLEYGINLRKGSV